MKRYDAIIIGGSAGSLDVLFRVLPGLRPDINFAIIIVLHRKAGTDELLANLLSTKTTLAVKEIEEKENIFPGVIYLAPPDYHVLVEKDNTFSLDASEKINYSRPSIDVTFASAAEIYNEKLACFLLSGSNTDGVEGLKKVKRLGGKAIIQNPQSALVAYMPAWAQANVEVDEILEIDEMANFINLL